MRIPKALMPHQVIVRAYEGTGANGDVFSPPVTVRAYIEDEAIVVIDGAGQEVPANATVWIDPDVTAPVLSKVTLITPKRPPVDARVITSTLYDHPAAPSHQVLHTA